MHLQDWQHLRTKSFTSDGKNITALTLQRNLLGTVLHALMSRIDMNGIQGCSVIVHEVWRARLSVLYMGAIFWQLSSPELLDFCCTSPHWFRGCGYIEVWRGWLSILWTGTIPWQLSSPPLLFSYTSQNWSKGRVVVILFPSLSEVSIASLSSWCIINSSALAMNAIIALDVTWGSLAERISTPRPQIVPLWTSRLTRGRDSANCK